MNIGRLLNLFPVVIWVHRMRSMHQALIVALAGAIATLNGCAVSEINGNVDALNRAVRGATSGVPNAVPASEPKPLGNSSADGGSAHRPVSFKRHVSGDADIVRPAVEDGAMQLRIGHDFFPTYTVDAMPFNWSASCDIFYLVGAHLHDWNPPADKRSGFSFREACALNEGGQAFRRSEFNDPIRRRNWQLNTSFGVSDTVREWLPVYESRQAEFRTYQGDRYFFVGVLALEVNPYDPVKQGFFVTADLHTAYVWNKPIIFVGKQLSDQRLRVNLRTDEALALTIDSARGSNYRLPARRTRVVFKLNGVNEFPDRIELNISLQKVEVPVYSSDGKSVVLVNVI